MGIEGLFFNISCAGAEARLEGCATKRLERFDPPVGVSWLDYPTLGFQTGHPDWRVREDLTNSH